MKRKILLVLIGLFAITGCGKNNIKINDETVILDSIYKDRYVQYKYPSSFKEILDEGNHQYPLEVQKIYEYYVNNKLDYIVKIEEYMLGISFSQMEKDAKELETDENNKNISHDTIKYNGKNFVRYSFNKSDEFSDNTLYHVYYGGYSYAGVYEYIKVYFINADGKDNFERAFMSSFKINR